MTLTPGNRIQLLLQLLVRKAIMSSSIRALNCWNLLIEMIQVAEQLLEHEAMVGELNLPCKRQFQLKDFFGLPCGSRAD